MCRHLVDHNSQAKLSPAIFGEQGSQDLDEDKYQVASARDGAHSLAVRNADVPVLCQISAWPQFNKNSAEISFAIKLRFAVCSSYFRTLRNLSGNLAVLFPMNCDTLAS